MKSRILFLTLLISVFCGFSQTYNIATINGTTVNTCGGTFTDSGGTGSNYANNQNYSATFCSSSGNYLMFDFSASSSALNLDSGTGDTLYFYDGTSATGTPIAFLTSSDDVSFTQLMINTMSTCVTVVWHSNGSGVDGGWAATISCGYPPLCADNPPASDIFGQATAICNLDNYCGTTASYYGEDLPYNLGGGGDCPAPTDGIFGGTIENNSWLSFQALATSASFEFTVSNCSGDGIQVGIFGFNGSAFNLVSPCNLTDGSQGGTFTVTASGLTIGNTYYIMIDGNAGANCDYVIHANTGVAVVNAGPDQNICVNNTTMAATVPMAGTGVWSVIAGTGTFSNINSATSTVSGLTTGVNTFVWTIPNGPCENVSDTVNVTVTGGIVPTISYATPFCASVTSAQPVTLTGPGGGTYTVSPAGLSINASTGAITPSASTPGTYTVSYTVAGACSPATTTVVINASVTPVFTITNSFCSGTAAPSLPAASNNGITGTWSPATISNTSSANYTFTPAAGQCASNYVLSVTVNPLPVASAGSDQVLSCTAGSVVLNGTGSSSGAGFSYLWTTSGGNIVSGGSTNSATVNAAGTYTILVTNTTTGCTATDQAVVTNNTSLPVANAGADFTKTCTLNPSGSVIGSASVAGNTYLWSPATGLSATNVSNPTANPTTTTTYTVTVTNTASGCTATDNVVVTVNTTLPVANAGADFTKTCTLNPAGAAIGSASIAGNTYLWSPATGLSATNVSNPTANPTTTTTYTVTVTNTASGCTATDNVVVTVNTTLPVANAGADFTKTCTLNPAGAAIGSASIAGNTYLWSPATGLSATNVSNPTANPTTTTTYTVTVTNSASGCTATDNVVVTVNTTLPVANAGADFTKTCTLNPSGSVIGSASVAGNTYLWSPATGLSATNVSNPTANPTTTTTYTVTVTNSASGCTATDNVVVTVNTTLPVANAGADFTKTCTLNPSGSVIGSASVAGNTYLWSPATGLSATNVSNPTANPTTTTTYTVTVTNTASGCTATDNVVVTVNTTLPVANAGADFTKTCTLNPAGAAIGSASVAGNTYFWSPATGLSATNVSNPTANPTTTTTYTVTVTNTTSGCTATDNVVVTVNTTLPLANAGSDQSLSCLVSSINLNGSGSSSGIGYTYSWTTVGGNIVSGAATTSPVVNAPGTYTIVVTNSSNGCTASDQVAVSSDGSVPVASAGSDQTINCLVTSVVLNGSGSSSGSGYSILWSTTGGNIVSGSATTNPTVNAAGTYTITVTNTANGCTATDAVIVTVNTAPPMASAGSDTELNCILTSINLNGSGSSTGINFSYLWSTTGGNIVSGGTSLSPVINQPGTYTITVTNTTNGCTAVDQVMVTQNITLPLVNAGTDTELNCLISEAFLNGAGTSTGPDFNYQWTTTDGHIVSGSNTLSPLVNQPGSYNLLTTNSQNGCFNTDVVMVLEDVLIPVADAGTDQTLTCLAMSMDLDGSGSSSGAGYTYQWTTTDGNIVSGSNTLTPHVDNAGTYVLLVTNTQNGCSETDEVVISSNINLPVANAGNDQEICSGEQINLGIPGNINYTYSWSPGTGLSNTTSSDPSFEMTNLSGLQQSYTFTLLVTDNISGCAATDEVTVLVNPEFTPAISISATETDICEGISVTFAANVENQGSAPSYQWLVNGANTGTSTDVFSSSTLQNGDVVSCILTSSVLCPTSNPVYSNQIVMTVGSTMPVSVTINQYPVGTICEGTTVVFNATAVNGGTSPVYQWQVNGVNVGANSPSFSSTGLADGDVVSCSVASSEECATGSPANDQITISTYPDVSLTLFTNTPAVCQGGQVVINAVVSGGNGGPYTLTSPGQGIISNPFIISPEESGNITIIANDNCTSDTEEIYIEVVESPQVTIFADIRKGCEPLTVTFTSEVTQSGVTYEWNFGDMEYSSSGTSNPQHIYDESGVFDVTLVVTNETGCSTQLTQNGYIQVYEVPVASFTADNQIASIVDPELYFYNYSTGGTNYYWTFGDGSMSNQYEPSHVFQAVGTYAVQLAVVSQHGCTDTAEMTVEISEELTFYAPSAFTPNNDGFNEVFFVTGTGIDPSVFKMVVFDRWGEQIFESNDLMTGWDGKVKGNEVAENGTYTWIVIYRDIRGVEHEKAGPVTLIR